MERVSIDGVFDGADERIWQFVSLLKYPDGYMFRDSELDLICNGPFSPDNVEILGAFNRVVRFALIRGFNELLINLVFAGHSSVPLFFGDIRWPQRRVMIVKLVTSNR